MAKQFDRRAEDLGNIVGLEHVNLQIPDQGLATLFYVGGLGLTRDPYLMPASTTCGSMSGAASSICRPASRRCCAATPAW